MTFIFNAESFNTIRKWKKKYIRICPFSPHSVFTHQNLPFFIIIMGKFTIYALNLPKHSVFYWSSLPTLRINYRNPLEKITQLFFVLHIFAIFYTWKPLNSRCNFIAWERNSMVRAMWRVAISSQETGSFKKGQCVRHLPIQSNMVQSYLVSCYGYCYCLPHLPYSRYVLYGEWRCIYAYRSNQHHLPLLIVFFFPFLTVERLRLLCTQSVYNLQKLSTLTQYLCVWNWNPPLIPNTRNRLQI